MGKDKKEVAKITKEVKKAVKQEPIQENGEDKIKTTFPDGTVTKRTL